RRSWEFPCCLQLLAQRLQQPFGCRVVQFCDALPQRDYGTVVGGAKRLPQPLEEFVGAQAVATQRVLQFDDQRVRVIGIGGGFRRRHAVGRRRRRSRRQLKVEQLVQ